MTKMKKLPIAIVFWLGLLMLGTFCSKSQGALQWNYEAPKELDADNLAQSQPPEANVEQQEAVVRPKVEYKAAGLRDPFQPLVIEKKIDTTSGNQPQIEQLPVLTVQGLIWGGAFPQAIINNRVVKIGDSIGEVKIAAIDKEGVTVLFANKEHKLSSPAVLGPQQKEKK